MRNSKKKGVNAGLEFSEDKQTIGTKRYAKFQKMCSKAGSLAIKKAQARGLPLTYVENDKIIKEYADGKKEILGKVKPRIKISRFYKIP